jgi:hypothetical protein
MLSKAKLHEEQPASRVCWVNEGRFRFTPQMWDGKEGQNVAESSRIC